MLFNYLLALLSGRIESSSSCSLKSSGHQKCGCWRKSFVLFKQNNFPETKCKSKRRLTGTMKGFQCLCIPQYSKSHRVSYTPTFLMSDFRMPGPVSASLHFDLLLRILAWRCFALSSARSAKKRSQTSSLIRTSLVAAMPIRTRAARTRANGARELDSSI